MSKIYLASGFFDDFQNKHVTSAEDYLRSKGFEVFSPREHQNEQLEFGSKEWRQATFDNDVNHIVWCDFVFAILDDKMDEGVLWEIGYAHAIGRPVVLLDLSNRVINLMVSDSITAYLEDWDDAYSYDLKTLRHKPYTGEVI
ncbi:nucleoside 2-deoxyribosyltransferase [Priestia aryabhattai]|uniref:nucleoside 2-deoxyribosyltransferase n=1 Tax=Priestia aryabhattai TaxID=412384 RepID=UPI002880CB7E|nr:nucleoside 2-deoxyribosyltransferase [Priestia aryabhattai]MDT0150021.1 nucleoside 2-deoxyribosyltransferase [Priestia aryabhattai]MDT0155591.1 nucleoside 2-deoxyribosyltransferase [Priestia aryabhattai]